LQSIVHVTRFKYACRGCCGLVLWLMAFAAVATESAEEAWGAVEVAWDRIIPGWTNYSTAFNATHDVGTLGDYASVAARYTPEHDVRLEEFSVIVIGNGTRPPEFDQFQFRIMVWSGLESLIAEPRKGEVAEWNFVAPTGGSVELPDTQTRGGRGAYLLRFLLTNRPLTWEAGRSQWIGFAARGTTHTAGELYVPSSSQAGESDVQAGDLVVGGWRYLVDAGGSTLYSGRLAAGLTARRRVERPRLQISLRGVFLELSWPVSTAAGPGFVLESIAQLPGEAAAGGDWQVVETEPEETGGQWRVWLPAAGSQRWFRLRR
jgi:hypothetical protein